MQAARPIPVRVLIVDDHKVVRLGLRTLLTAAGISIAGEAGGVREALQQTMALSPDVVLMDVRLPDGSGIEGCREIRKACPNTRVLILTSYHDEQAVVAALSAGAHGFFPKETDEKGLIHAIQTISDGHYTLDPLMARSLVRRLQATDETRMSKTVLGLTTQELAVLALVARGKTNKEISGVLRLSEKTIRNYLSRIFDKLNVSRRSEAATFYTRYFDEESGSPEAQDPGGTDVTCNGT